MQYRALIVDDDQLVRRLTTRALSGCEMMCTAVASAIEAREQIAKQPFDLVVVDLCMPGEHGYVLVCQLLEQNPRPTVVVLTGVIEPRLELHLRGLGVDEVEYKPVEYRSFARRLVELTVARNEVPLDSPLIFTTAEQAEKAEEAPVPGAAATELDKATVEGPPHPQAPNSPPAPSEFVPPSTPTECRAGELQSCAEHSHVEGLEVIPSADIQESRDKRPRASGRDCRLAAEGSLEHGGDLSSGPPQTSGRRKAGRSKVAVRSVDDTEEILATTPSLPPDESTAAEQHTSEVTSETSALGPAPTPAHGGTNCPTAPMTESSNSTSLAAGLSAPMPRSSTGNVDACTPEVVLPLLPRQPLQGDELAASSDLGLQREGGRERPLIAIRVSMGAGTGVMLAAAALLALSFGWQSFLAWETKQTIEALVSLGSNLQLTASGGILVQLPNESDARAVDLLAKLSNVEVVDVHGTDLGDQELARLAKMGTIKRLDLSHTRVTDHGIAELPALDRLETLYLDGNQISSQSVTSLQDIPSLKHLSVLDTSISREAVERLQFHRPQLEVTWEQPYSSTTPSPPEASELQDQTSRDQT